MFLLFSGLARNCGSSILQNITHLIDCCRDICPGSFSIYICENDSYDDTRKILLSLTSKYSELRLVLLDRVDETYPDRVTRLAYCRQTLLDRIRNEIADRRCCFYIPIDLDAEIASSLKPDQLQKVLKLMERSWIDALFPFSRPYYYDIYALRAKRWCMDDCLKRIKDSRLPGKTGRLLRHVRYISSRQWRYFPRKDLIRVDSAFGGIGIYRFDSITTASYLHDVNGIERSDDVCEHVVFNSSIDSKFICTSWTVEAPLIHIYYRSLTWRTKLRLIAEAMALDVLDYAQSI